MTASPARLVTSNVGSPDPSAEERRQAVVDAERALLGCILLRAARGEPALDGIPIDAVDFSFLPHREIFAAMVEVNDRGERIDPITLETRLAARGKIKAIGGIAYLSEINSSPGIVESVGEYARIVRDAARGRQIVAMAADIRDGMERGQPADDVLARVRRKLEILEPRQELGPFHASAWRRLGQTAWLTTEAPEREYLFSWREDRDHEFGLLPDHRVALFIGAGGKGKSLGLLEAGLSVASGAPWFETFHAVRPGPVCILAGEEDGNEAWRRVRDVAGCMHLSAEQRERAAANTIVIPLSGQDVRLQRNQDDGGQPTAAYHDLVRRLEADRVDWRLIVIDPASRFAPGDMETDNAAATSFVQLLERLTQIRGGPTVLVSHHVTKTGRNGYSEATAARGASALVDGARWVANLDGVTVKRGRERDQLVPGLALFHVTKSNYGRFPDELLLANDPRWGGALRLATFEERVRFEELGAARQRNGGGAAPDAGDDSTIARTTEKILMLLAREPRTQTILETLAGGNRNTTRRCIEDLAAAGRIVREKLRAPWRLATSAEAAGPSPEDAPDDEESL